MSKYGDKNIIIPKHMKAGAESQKESHHQCAKCGRQVYIVYKAGMRCHCGGKYV